MKGISLALESIIILIIAVSVLGILMIIFRGGSTDFEDEIKWRGIQNRVCSSYASFAGAEKCEDKKFGEFGEKFAKDSDELFNACIGLGECYNKDFDCIKKCCKTYLGCP